MPDEVERKFLVTDPAVLATAVSRESILQAYPLAGANYSVRIRIVGDEGKLTIKSRAPAVVREEIEIDIPLAVAADLIQTSSRKVRKTRYSLVDTKMWSVDVFHDENEGLVIAEAELLHKDAEADIGQLPPWVGREVTFDVRYYNESLANRPYATWQTAD